MGAARRGPIKSKKLRVIAAACLAVAWWFVASKDPLCLTEAESRRPRTTRTTSGTFRTRRTFAAVWHLAAGGAAAPRQDDAASGDPRGRRERGPAVGRRSSGARRGLPRLRDPARVPARAAAPPAGPRRRAGRDSTAPRGPTRPRRRWPRASRARRRRCSFRTSGAASATGRGTPPTASRRCRSRARPAGEQVDPVRGRRRRGPRAQGPASAHLAAGYAARFPLFQYELGGPGATTTRGTTTTGRRAGRRATCKTPAKSSTSSRRRGELRVTPDFAAASFLNGARAARCAHGNVLAVHPARAAAAPPPSAPRPRRTPLAFAARPRAWPPPRRTEVAGAGAAPRLAAARCPRAAAASGLSTQERA